MCVGSREYQFNRLLKKLDELIEQGEIKEEVFAQIGKSTYIPKNYKFERFMSVVEFKECQRKAHLVISHGGTGALIGALKLEKQLLAVPRLARYGEHIDDHQTQVAEVLAEEGYLYCVLNMDELLNGINKFERNPIKKRYNKPSKVLSIIQDFMR
ncbi:PssE/Cps14G family polysaccharide biosynthesis glycosyltransferase [Pseudalkalibacillus hwajinpoensis]|uniref:PssE/Cps14G family polysaccharide biosynthesis glycosyltransferase n=1 Tax=Guptibacillus hwajinpoensis TaxID=208199 RepID=UPI001F117907|nr:PssE/Cps14G family polysaccharide biosynthesis glycosyltransferase [Pseudalkalibacillus hwajinpoensis]